MGDSLQLSTYQPMDPRKPVDWQTINSWSAGIQASKATPPMCVDWLEEQGFDLPRVLVAYAGQKPDYANGLPQEVVIEYVRRYPFTRRSKGKAEVVAEVSRIERDEHVWGHRLLLEVGVTGWAGCTCIRVVTDDKPSGPIAAETNLVLLSASGISYYGSQQSGSYYANREQYNTARASADAVADRQRKQAFLAQFRGITCTWQRPCRWPTDMLQWTFVLSKFRLDVNLTGRHEVFYSGRSWDIQAVVQAPDLIPGT